MPELTFHLAGSSRAPRFSVAEGVTLGLALLEASRGEFPAPVLQAAARLRAAVEAGQAANVEKARVPTRKSKDDPRRLDREADLSWGALKARLDAATLLPAARYPQSPRATELLRLLFGKTGL